jgi:anti-sigma factor ChrR (cupin superfamily)
VDSNPFALLIYPDDLDWIETGSSNAMKVLRVSEETNGWTALIKAAAGTVNARHRHLGPADFFVISGSIEYRGGFARAGAWVYEPAGVLHEATSHPEETVYLANVHGPIAMLDDNDNVIRISDGASMAKLAASAGRTATSVA